MNFDLIDIIVFVCYCTLVIGLGLWVSREKKGVKKDAKDYFLASKALPWWAVGASLIASNISAEQFIGMSGSGFAIGMGIASYEFMAALTLIIVAAFFLPIYIHRGIYTMPQFLEQRFDKRVKSVMAIFWLVVFIFVNLTSILYLGALAMKNMMGVDLMWGIVILAVFAVVYSIYGGLKAVAWTDVIQVVFLIGGGLVTTYVAFKLLGGGASIVDGQTRIAIGEGNFMDGVREMWAAVGPKSGDNRFNMILEKGDILISDSDGGVKDAYMDLPGLAVLLGGLWVANLYYWGCNQYIIQRALASKSLDQAQKGLVFAGFLKILLPLIIVIPGIICYVMIKDWLIVDTIGTTYDNAYPTLLSMVPAGVRGVAFAALIAAIVSSLASMMNSISSIFTLDVYKSYFNKNLTDTGSVKVGRITSIVALIIAIFVAPVLSNLDQAFQYIQEFTGFVSPGALAIFLAGFFYKKANANGALAAAVGTFVFSLAFKFLLPGVPFMDRMGYTFLLCCLLIVLFAEFSKKTVAVEKVTYPKGLFKTSTGFKVGSAIIVVLLAVIYIVWW
ncbi:MAG: sodium/sugar symporter [Rikenellaceae bacterium]|nr:sodium/sugar symporter [Rikenellaceae bacterium]